MQYFESIVVGQTVRAGAYEVTLEDSIDFATKYDPQPFHLSDEGTAGTPFERLSISGWQTCGIAMRLYVEHVLSGFDSKGGLGVDRLRWPHPVYPGDVLTLECVVADKRESRSRPGLGLIEVEMRLFNQDNHMVMELKSTGMVGCDPNR
ncbi:MaoC family dehydratase [Croceicoccus gelatinilyticus]|uniref:MaoC family dehydratase n=1 Tax=Croceicoccus gelatinilyticus TaxID=2835536 RepID=UPI001BCC9630|nr:MaoC family dehydratase [Croceicoccus gelatinilyticus]MBS7668855.1 MaoC family dehydratase [Croceicoccus gelatinilyticus]